MTLNLRLSIMLRFFTLIFLFPGSFCCLQAQITVHGKVIDPISREALPYVNIGIKNKNIGTTSLQDGSFSLTLPAAYQNDSLTFSLIGYSDFILPANTSSQKLIPLLRKPKTFEEVSVTTTALKEKKYGLKNRSAIHFIDAMTNAGDIFEIAQVIKLPDQSSRISSVNLYISGTSTDSIAFRINFYAYNGQRPTERLFEAQILRKEVLKEGWLSIDLSKLRIYAKGQVVVSLEFLPDPTTKNPIRYEIKLGGRSRSFYKKNSQGEWHVPPHHYLMYVTALVPEKTKENTEDEKDTPANLHLFSKHVKDSFSIFVHLPKNYFYQDKTTRYPVVYLLDANAYFDQVARYLDQSSKSHTSPAILVGIGYRNALEMDSLRDRDYSFPNVKACGICGGGEKFRKFVHGELIPDIDKKFNTLTNNNTLMGHSLGGYFVLYDFIRGLEENSAGIRNYIAISTAFDYTNNYLAEKLREALKTSNASDTKKVVLACGKKEENESGKAAGDDQADFLSGLKTSSSITFLSLEFPGLEHMETVVPGFEKGLEFMLGK